MCPCEGLGRRHVSGQAPLARSCCNCVCSLDWLYLSRISILNLDMFEFWEFFILLLWTVTCVRKKVPALWHISRTGFSDFCCNFVYVPTFIDSCLLPVVYIHIVIHFYSWVCTNNLLCYDLGMWVSEPETANFCIWLSIQVWFPRSLWLPPNSSSKARATMTHNFFDTRNCKKARRKITKTTLNLCTRSGAWSMIC